MLTLAVAAVTGPGKDGSLLIAVGLIALAFSLQRIFEARA